MESPLAAEEPSSTALTDYEKQRLENVKRNQAMIDALGLQHFKNEIQLDNASNIKRRLRSSSVSCATKDAQKTKSAPRPQPEKRILTPKSPRKPKPFPLPLPLASVCIQGSSTYSFIRCLQDMSHCQSIEPSAFSLQKGNVAKVLPERIMSVAFLPVSHKLVVVAGDKGGNLGFWDVDCDDSECDRVYVYRPHTAPVSGISVTCFSATKVTSSTDTNVRVWDVRKLTSERDKVGHIQHQEAVHSAQFSPSGSSIVTCSYDNTVAILKLFSNRQPTFIAHPNRNNRWISTFRAIWGWDDEYVYVGNMKRTIDIISTKYEIECHCLSSPLMESIPCRLAAHPLRCGILSGCSADGQIFVWRQ